MRVFSQINNCQQEKDKNKNKQTNKENKKGGGGSAFRLG